MTPIPTPHLVGPRDWAALLLLTVLWGSAFAVIKHGVQTLPPGALIFVRLGLAAVVLTAWTHLRGHRLPPLRDRRWLWLGGLGLFGNALPFFMVSWAQQYIDSALAGILVATMPLVTVGLAHLFVPGERMTVRAILGLLVGFAGVILLLGPSALAGLGGTDTLAQLAVIGAAICYAINAIQARLLPDTSPSVSAAGMLIMATIFAAPLGVWDLAHVAQAAPSAWVAAAWLAVGPTAFASVILMHVARTAGPNFLAIANYLTPIAALLTGWMIGETLGWPTILALVVILSGVWLARGGKPAP